MSISVDRQVAYVEIDRPDAANAINGILFKEIDIVFDRIDKDSDIHVAVLSGNGRHFSSGIDFAFLQEIFAEVALHEKNQRPDRLRQIILDLQRAFSCLELCQKPVLAAIDGVCLGAGVDLIAGCDMRYATANATFSIKEVDLGIVADIGSLQRLPKLVGQGMLRELAFTGCEFGGSTALSIGLVNRVFPDKTTLLQEVGKIALQIAGKPPAAIKGIKDMLNYARDHSVADSLDYVSSLNATILLSHETKQAIANYVARCLSDKSK